MPELSTILNGEKVSLAKMIVGHWDGDGDYSDVVPLYGSVDLTANVSTVSAQRYGDGGAMLASYARITGGTATLEYAGDITSLAVMLGFDPETVGTTPDAIRAFRLYNKHGLPYFGLIGAADLDDGTPNGEHFFAPKCQVVADSIQVFSVGGGEEAEFRNVSLEIMILPDDNYEDGAVNEVQLLTLGTPTVGTYTLTFGGQTTTALAYNANAAAIDAALEALANIGAGDVAVTVATPSGFDITFGGAFAATRVPIITGVGAGGFDGVITIARSIQGNTGYSMFAAIYEVEGGYTPALPPLFAV